MTARLLKKAVPHLPPVLEFLGVLWELNHRLEVTSSEMLRTLGITAQQRMMLRVVGILQPISAGVLAQTLHVHPGTLSASLKRLERKRLLVRQRDDDDARRIMVTLSARGASIAATLDGTVEQAVLDVFADTAPARVMHTQALLKRIAAALPERTD